MADPIKEFETFANEMLSHPGGQARLIEHIRNNGAPVDPVELLETLTAPRGDVLRLVFTPMGENETMFFAVRARKGF